MEKTKQQQEAQAAANRVISAYRHVFGVEGHRSEAQRIVWEDMRKRAKVDGPVFILDSNQTLCPLRAAFADGQRLNFIQTEQIVKAVVQEEKQEPEVKR